MPWTLPPPYCFPDCLIPYKGWSVLVLMEGPTGNLQRFEVEGEHPCSCFSFFMMKMDGGSSEAVSKRMQWPWLLCIKVGFAFAR